MTYLNVLGEKVSVNELHTNSIHGNSKKGQWSSHQIFQPKIFSVSLLHRKCRILQNSFLGNEIYHLDWNFMIGEIWLFSKL